MANTAVWCWHEVWRTLQGLGGSLKSFFLFQLVGTFHTNYNNYKDAAKRLEQYKDAAKRLERMFLSGMTVLI